MSVAPANAVRSFTNPAFRIGAISENNQHSTEPNLTSRIQEDNSNSKSQSGNAGGTNIIPAPATNALPSNSVLTSQPHNTPLTTANLSKIRPMKKLGSRAPSASSSKYASRVNSQYKNPSQATAAVSPTQRNSEATISSTEIGKDIQDGGRVLSFRAESSRIGIGKTNTRLVKE